MNKDERNAIRLLAKVEDLDLDKVRELTKRFLCPIGIGRLEEYTRRAGYPKARRAYTASA